MNLHSACQSLPVPADSYAVLTAYGGDPNEVYPKAKAAASLINLRTDFQFDFLRSDPRYAELVRKIGFPQ